MKKIHSILYVEDEKRVQEELSEVLNYFCDELLVADNGEDALALFQEYNPELIITDIQMPKMSGIELCKAIKKINSHTGIIFTTAFSDANYMQEAISLYADGYIIKPIDLDLLENTVQKCIEIHLLRAELEQKNKYESEKNAELETILSTTKDGIVILDLQGQYLFVNKAYEEILGYPFLELQKQKEFIELVNKVIQEGSIENFEKQYIRADKKVITLSTSATLMPDKNRILLATRDITNDINSKKLLKEYVNLINENIITSTTDLKGILTSVSEAFCKISGYTKEELIGSPHRMIRHEETASKEFVKMWKKLEANEKWEGELKNTKKNGDFYWVFEKNYPVMNKDGIKEGYTAICENITDLKKVEELSIRDAMTNIYNRRYFNEVFPKYINSGKRYKEEISFAILDIDNFKEYNDVYGHHAGDTTLIKVATAINSLLHRSDDYFFRVGGEEFALLFKTSKKKQSNMFIQKVLQSVEDLQIVHKKSTISKYVTISIGLVTRHAEEITNGDSLYQHADTLLYEAKSRGRNNVAIYNE